MRSNKCLFIVMAMLVVALNLYAALDVLPTSSHYQGRSYFNGLTQDQQVLSGYIDFAVYDTQAGNELSDAGFSAPGQGQYVYAYQIFSDADESTTSIDYFAILGIGQNAVPDQATSEYINAEDDLNGGLDPEFNYFTSQGGEYVDKAVWEFDNGLFVSGEHSAFLLISSDHDWTVGGYTLENTGNDAGLPTPNPEPASLAIMALGSYFLCKKK